MIAAARTIHTPNTEQTVPPAVHPNLNVSRVYSEVPCYQELTG
ncbi:protein of unknown function [Cyanobium sp. NIES-981]|nr:protein of unknown function [Cyanobium sp. NIES-981]